MKSLEDLWRARRPAELLRAAEAALRRRPGDPALRYYRGAALLESGRADRALADLEAALRNAPSPARRVRAGRALAQADIRLGRPLAADRRLRALRRFARTPRDRRRLESDRAIALRVAGRFDESRRLLERLLPDYRRAGDPNDVAAVETALGNLDLEEGRYASAFRRLERAAVGFRRARNVAGAVRAEHNRGMAFLCLRLVPEAESSFRRAGGAARRAGLVSDALRARYGLALAAEAGGDGRRAETNLDRLRRRALRDPALQIAASISLARLRLDRGAATAAASVLADLRPPSGGPDEAHLLTIRAAVHLARGAWGETRRALAALARHPVAIRPEIRLEAAVIRARLAVRAGRKTEARRTYAEALEALEALLADAGSPEARIFAASRRESVVAEAVRFAINTGRSGEAVAIMERADRVKAAAMMAPPTTGPAAAAAVRARTRLVAALRRAERPGRSERPSVFRGAEAPETLRSVREAEKRLTAIRLGSTFAARARRLVPIPPDPVRAMVRACGDGAADAILRFFVDKEGVSLIAANSRGSTVMDKYAPNLQVCYHLAKLVEELDKSERNSRGQLMLGRKGPLHQSVRHLDDAILRPLRKKIPPVGHWHLIPYGVLHALPFGLLHDDRSYLAERTALSYRAPGGAIDAVHRWEPTNRRATVVVGGASGLTHAIDEVRTITEALEGKGWEVRMLGGKMCSRASIARALETSSVVHFTGHAVLRADAPMYSHLVLGPNNPLFVQDLLSEIRPTERRPLVVLAACEAGAASGPAGALLSIAHAFLARGAGAVIVSDRRVDDAATAKLMGDFYGSLAACEDPVQALRAAQENRIRDLYTEHPLYWGSWRVVTG